MGSSETRVWFSCCLSRGNSNYQGLTIWAYGNEKKKTILLWAILIFEDALIVFSDQFLVFSGAPELEMESIFKKQ